MRNTYPFALALILATAIGVASAPLPGFAAGGGGSVSTPSRQEADYDKAVKLVKAEKYRDAIDLLQKVVQKEPRNADAWNYLGYSQRKTGQMDVALASYNKALDIDPRHLGAHEYLGELYLQVNDLPKAEALLKKLSAMCDRCEQRQDLEKAVAAYKKAKGIS